MKLTFHPAQAVTTPEEVMERFLASGHDPEEVRIAVEQFMGADLFLDETNTYQVMVRETANGFGAPMVHLSIKRIDQQPIGDWRVMQAIKNAIVGEECEGFELYPAETRLVDTCNQFHLYVFTDPKIRIPCGFTERLVDGESKAGALQRPFEESTPA
jgi:hypothetical protein